MFIRCPFSSWEVLHNETQILPERDLIRSVNVPLSSSSKLMIQYLPAEDSVEILSMTVAKRFCSLTANQSFINIWDKAFQNCWRIQKGTGIVKSSICCSVNIKYIDSIKTRWFHVARSGSEKSSRCLWVRERPYLTCVAQPANNPSTQDPRTSFEVPSEGIIEPRLLQRTTIFQALGGVPQRHNTSAMKYFWNIRSCGARTQMISDAAKSKTMGNWFEPIRSLGTICELCGEFKVTLV